MRYTARAYIEAGLAPRAALKLAGSVIGTGEDGLFTTVALAVYDASAASLTYATAGHPPPLMLGGMAHEPLTICASPALGLGVRSGRRQTTVPFPKGARACFFSDGLVEARTDHGLLGRRRLAAMFADVGPQPSARALLEQVQAHAQEIRDDMAACIIEAASAPVSAGAETRLEELELDAEQLALGHGHRFLVACGVAGDQIAPMIACARVIASSDGLAVIAVKLSGRARRAAALVLPAVTPTIAQELRTDAPTRRSPYGPTEGPFARPESLTPA
jgi:hypothetical protein